MRIFIFVLALLSSSAFGFEVPAFRPNVVDETGTLDKEARERINRTIDSMNEKIKPAVLIVKTLRGVSIEEAAEQTFRTWSLGEKGKDNGVLILVSVKDRKMRIEVGYGLEGELTDYFCAHIIGIILQPNFREGRFEEGIILSLKEMALKVHGQSNLPSRPPSLDAGEDFRLGKELAKSWVMLFLIIPALINSFGLLVAALFRTKAFKALQANQEVSLLPFIVGVSSRPAIFIKLFLLFFLGIFFVILAVMTKDVPMIIWPLKIWALVSIAFSLIEACRNTIMLFSESMVRRREANGRLQKFIAKRVSGKTYVLFGKTFTLPDRSSSSGSRSSDDSSSSISNHSSHSSSDHSSSSGGGRSGGGGASGDW